MSEHIYIYIYIYISRSFHLIELRLGSNNSYGNTCVSRSFNLIELQLRSNKSYGNTRVARSFNLIELRLVISTIDRAPATFYDRKFTEPHLATAFIVLAMPRMLITRFKL